MLPRLKETLDACGFRGKIHENIQQLIWNKLFVNVALSAVTAVLNVKMGFIAQDPHAFALTKQLLHEAVTVAHALGLDRGRYRGRRAAIDHDVEGCALGGGKPCGGHDGAEQGYRLFVE